MARQTPSHLEPWRRLDNKVVLVTGASSGLGREFCLDLAKAGCNIVAAARRMDKLKSLCDQINNNSDDDVGSSRAASVRAAAVELDVTADGHAVEKAVERAWACFGHIDALINNAGIRGEIKSSIEVPEDEWEEVLKTNLTGSWKVAKYTCRQMKKTGRGGSIINISTVQALNRPQTPGAVAYGSSKAGVDTVTKHMAIELGKYNIRINSIAAGLFPSELTKDLFKKQWLINFGIRTIPLKYAGPTDPALTALIRYLVHDSSCYVSGNIFIADGGYSLPGSPIFSAM